MRRIDRLLGRDTRSSPGGLSWPDYLDYWYNLGFDGVNYILPGGGVEEISALTGGSNPIVAACIAVRAMVFSEVRFAWQQMNDGRPANLFSTPALDGLHTPWEGGDTGTLLTRMEFDASLYGRSAWIRDKGELVRLDPDKTRTIVEDVTRGETVIGRRLLGYAVLDDAGEHAHVFGPEEVAYYAPLLDTANPYEGRTWLRNILPEVTADREFTRHKIKFLDNAAVPGMAVTYPPDVKREQIEAVAEIINERHEGTGNAFKTLHLGGGADIKKVGSSLEEMNLTAVQGAGETRIASAAGVPAVIVGISEGLGGSALNSGNYGSTRRRFADGTIRPLWRTSAAALQKLATPVPAGGGVRLWYDSRDVPFLQEDEMDSASIRQADASTVRTLVDGGFDPDSTVDAVVSGDFTRLEHSGLPSVQVQPEAPTEEPPAPEPEEEPDEADA